jgi:hypothetical protein
MPLDATIHDDLQVNGNLIVLGGSATLPAINRSQFAQDDEAVFPIPFLDFRTNDDFRVLLPAAAASDDLGLIRDTDAWVLGAGHDVAPSLKGVAASGTTERQKAIVEVSIPQNYVDGESFGFRFHAGVDVATAQVDTTLDIECKKFDKDQGYGADLVSTSSQSINSLTMADKDFFLTASGLSAGDRLMLYVDVYTDDTGGTNGTVAVIGSVSVICDVKG